MKFSKCKVDVAAIPWHIGSTKFIAAIPSVDVLYSLELITFTVVKKIFKTTKI